MVYIVGQGDRSGVYNPFEKDPRDRVAHDFTALRYPTMWLDLTHDNWVLPDLLREALIKVMEYNKIEPNFQDPGRGRTGHFKYRQDANAPIPGVKTKGSPGISADPLSGRLYSGPPIPLEQYKGEPAVHFKLDSDLRLGIARSTGRALNSLAYARAVNEYECHEILSRHGGLSFRPLLCGRFKHRDGDSKTDRVVTDYRHQEIGAVALEWDPEWQSLSHFSVGFIYVFPTLSSERKPEALEAFLGLTEEIAALRYEAAIEAQIVQHAGHFGNFYFLESSGQIRQTDMDSCVQLAKQGDEYRPLWGPSLVRDLGMDLMRATANVIAFAEDNGSLMRNMEAKEINIFYPYLKGFFSRCGVSDNDIVGCAEKLQEEYVSVSSRLRLIADRIFESLRAEQREYALNHRSNVQSLNYIRQEIATIQVSMADIFFDYICELVQMSNLSERGFTLPNIDSAERRRRFQPGVVEFLRAVDADRTQRLDDEMRQARESAIRAGRPLPRNLGIPTDGESDFEELIRLRFQ